jgi:PAS domain-containing protein
MSKILKNAESVYQRAVEKLSSMNFNDDIDSITDPEHVKKIISELRLHRIELEMQNWELLKAVNEIEENRDYYQSFYENSPVGYMKIDKSGRVLRVNATLAKILDLDKVDVEKTNIYSFVQNEIEADKLHILLNKLVDFGDKQVFDFCMRVDLLNSPRLLVTATLEHDPILNQGDINFCLMPYDTIGRK